MNKLDQLDALSDEYDLVIVGAGPAGLAGAAKAAKLGLKVVVADENPAPGGQIYRGITNSPVAKKDILGKAYWQGTELARALQASNCDYTPQTTVWSAEQTRDDAGAVAKPATFDIGMSKGGKTRLIHARRLLLATGALERPFPVPGWTLPGVMTAGAAQIMLKTSGLVPAGRTVLAGSGPLLLLLADQLKRAGANIVGVLDTTAKGNARSALPHLPEFLFSSYSLYGLKLWVKGKFSLPIVNSVSNLRIGGTDKVERISFLAGAKEQVLECDHVLLHQGVIPAINMSNALGCAHRWDEGMHAWVPVIDDLFQSSVPGIAIAGDAGGIAGATSAAVSGRIAAVAAAQALDKVDARTASAMLDSLVKEAKRLGAGRKFIEALYRPASRLMCPTDPSTIICRCEEVTAGQVRETIQKLAVLGPNQLKAYLRTGMGPCQGRMCGPSVIELIAEERNVPVEEVGYFRLRMPVKPITLQELASVPQSTASKNAVMR